MADAWNCHETSAGFRRRRHAPDVGVDRRDCGHHRGARSNRSAHGGGETADPLAGFESLIDEGGSESARKPDPKHNSEAPDLIFQGHPLAHQLLARDDERADGVDAQ